MPTVDVDGITLHYREHGTGAPVVLLHPGPGIDGSVFFPELADLDARVIALDLPGNGLSGTPPDELLTLVGHATFVAHFAETLELQPYTLLGHSFGGFVTMQHMVSFPGHAARVIASCTEADEEPPADLEPHGPDALDEPYKAQVETAFEAEDHITSPDDARAAWLGQMPLFAADPADDARLRARFETVTYTVSPPRDWGDLHALDALAASDVPVLAIVGAQDRATPPAMSRRIAATAPHGTYVEIDGAGHFPWLESNAYVEAIRDWLAT